jgi:hypothetical protein
VLAFLSLIPICCAIQKYDLPSSAHANSCARLASINSLLDKWLISHHSSTSPKSIALWLVFANSNIAVRAA